MSRHWRVGPFIVLGLLLAAPLAAQDESGETIDILVPPEDYLPPSEDCSAEQEAASISGEIIVCRRRSDGGEYGYDKERAEREYAAKTMNKGDLRTPNVDGPGIFQGPATIGGVCGIGLNPCPPPPAYIIDFSTLPEAPPGSDADRIARGLAPRGSRYDEGEALVEAEAIAGSAADRSDTGPATDTADEEGTAPQP